MKNINSGYAEAFQGHIFIGKFIHRDSKKFIEFSEENTKHQCLQHYFSMISF